LIGLGGGGLGIIIGVGFSKLVEYIAANQLGTSLLKASFPFYLFAGCLTFAFFIGVISGTWPAWRAMKVKPVEALRYE
jgi:putative ABC transport system permease protein